jgi:hypothetical protein
MFPFEDVTSFRFVLRYIPYECLAPVTGLLFIGFHPFSIGDVFTESLSSVVGEIVFSNIELTIVTGCDRYQNTAFSYRVV